jgi:hypothetical protein
MAEIELSSIVNLINLYGVAMDTQRWDLFDRIFTVDVDADFGVPSHWRDLATFKKDFAAFHGPLDSTQHSMSNHVVNITGDTAHAFTYGSWRLIRRGLEGGDLWEGTGWYDDDLVRLTGQWRIKRRTCRVVYWNGNPLVHETAPGIRFSMRSSVLRREGEAGNVRFLNDVSNDLKN